MTTEPEKVASDKPKPWQRAPTLAQPRYRFQLFDEIAVYENGVRFFGLDNSIRRFQLVAFVALKGKQDGVLETDVEESLGVAIESRALAKLREHLNRSFGLELIAETKKALGKHLKLNGDVASVDVLEFDHAFEWAKANPTDSRSCEALRDAVELYKGPLLKDWKFKFPHPKTKKTMTEGRYEWVHTERIRRHNNMLEALEKLANDACTTKNYDQAITDCDKYIEYEPDVLSIYILKMEAFAGAGNEQGVRNTHEAWHERVTTPPNVTENSRIDDVCKNLLSQLDKRFQSLSDDAESCQKSIRDFYQPNSPFSTLYTWEKTAVGDLMDNCFIPLHVAARGDENAPTAEGPRAGARDYVVQALNQDNRDRGPLAVALLGESGSGKTTTLRNLATDCARNPDQFLWKSKRLVPLYLDLDRLDRHHPDEVNLFTHIQEQYPLGGSDAGRNQWRHLIEHGQVLILADTFDQHPMAGMAILNMPLLQGCPTVVSCRSGWADWLPKRYRPLELQRVFFDATSGNKVVSGYVRKHLADQPEVADALTQRLKDNPSFRELASVPSDLSLLCTLAGKGKFLHGLPDTRVHLYHVFLQYIWDRIEIEQRSSDSRTGRLHARKYQQILERLCVKGVVAMLAELSEGWENQASWSGELLLRHRREADQISQNANSGRIAIAIAEDAVDPNILDELARFRLIDLDRHAGYMVFKHQAIHGYLIASGLGDMLLTDDLEAWALLDRISWLPGFQDTIMLLYDDIARRMQASGKTLTRAAHIAATAAKMLGVIAAADGDDDGHHRLLLACTVATGFHSGAVSPEIGDGSAARSTQERT